MVLANITFGRAGRHKPSDLEDLVLDYLAAALHNGQICGEYFYAWRKGTLRAYVHLASPTALAPKHHAKWSSERLKKVTSVFGRKPSCAIIEDATPRAPSGCRASWVLLRVQCCPRPYRPENALSKKV